MGLKLLLRKGNAHVHVTYLDGDFTNNLYASEFSVEADDQRVIFSMDFSTNQRTRSKNGNSYHDVLALMENHDRVKFLQIHREEWLNGLASALVKHKSAEWLIEMKFLGGVSHVHTFKPEPNQHDVFLEFVQNVPEPTT